MRDLEIESLAFGGEAVGRLDGKVVFVPFAAPGDRVRVRILQETASFCRAELLEVLQAGPGRRPPPCPYFGRCGGCQWQHLEYPRQMEQKQSILRGALAALLPVDAIEPLEAAPRELGYRRRVRLRWRAGGGGRDGLELGYQRWRSHELLDVTSCPLLEDPLQRGVEACREALSGLTGGAGTLVALVGVGGEVQISLRIDHGDPGWVGRVTRQPPGPPVVGGLVQSGRQQRASFGVAHLELPVVDGRPLRGTAATFVQASVEGERALRRTVLEWSAPAGRRVLELHAGIGTFTRELAARASELTAVELSSEALALLRESCAGLPVRVQAGDAAAVARELGRNGERFEVIVLDPPREGSPRLAEAVAALEARRVVYVSCDPMTLARDLRSWRGHGWELRRAVAIDVMPQSYHIETVALLER